MATLRDKESGKLIGRISDEDVQFLVDQLEEESRDDTDYWVDADTLAMLEENGASSSLLSLLRSSISGKEGIDVQWSRD